jgi:hypothetical protein
MDVFTKLFGEFLVFVYHRFDRIVIHGYLTAGKGRPTASACRNIRDEFPKIDHRALPLNRRIIGESVRRPAIQGMPSMAGHHENWGIFKFHKWGELLRHSHGCRSWRSSAQVYSA